LAQELAIKMAAFTGLVTPWGQEHDRALLQPARRRPCQQPCTEKLSLTSSAVVGFVMLLTRSRTCHQATSAATRSSVRTRKRDPVLTSIDVESPNFKVQNEARAEKNVVMLVDGTGLLHSYYYAIVDKGEKSGPCIDKRIDDALGYFINRLYQFRKMLEPELSHMAVMLDHENNRGSRLEFLDTYKAHRSSSGEGREGLRTLITRAPQACEAHGIAWRWSPGYEADDLVATYCFEAQKDSVVHIFSADKDLVQLVNDDVRVYQLSGSKLNGWHTVDSILSEYKIHPRAWADLLALTGDTCDNIRGIAGIGPKRAKALLEHFGDLPSILKGVESEELPGKVCGRTISANVVENLRKSGKKAVYYRDNLIKLKMVPGIDASRFREDFKIIRGAAHGQARHLNPSMSRSATTSHMSTCDL